MIFSIKLSRKYKKKHILIRILNTILIVIMGGIIYSFGVALYENIQVKIDIEAFKARATTEIEETIEYKPGVFQTRIYHIVPRETYDELADTRSVFYDNTMKYLGQTGDIFMTQESPFPNVPIFHQFMTSYFGGHAAFKAENNTFYEATGMTNSFDEVITAIKQPNELNSELGIEANQTGDNWWLNPNYRDDSNPDYDAYGSYYREKFIGVRVKGITDEQLSGLVDFGESIEDKAAYNYLFFLDMTNKYYCTDMVSRAYQSVMFDEDQQSNYSKALNDDGFITSVNDMILSNDTYIIFYVEIIDDVVNIYHLADV